MLKAFIIEIKFEELSDMLLTLSTQFLTGCGACPLL